MARPREFKENKALDGAIKIFWKQGYNKTTLPDLLHSMGLTRGSFYAAFTDKFTTFRLALERYHTVNLKRVLTDMRSQTDMPFIDRMLILFEEIDILCPAEHRLGCFICNTMVEFGTTDPIIAQRIDLMINDIETCFYDILCGNGKDSTSAKSQSKAILQLYLGAQAVHKSGGQVTDFCACIEKIVV